MYSYILFLYVCVYITDCSKRYNRVKNEHNVSLESSVWKSIHLTAEDQQDLLGDKYSLRLQISACLSSERLFSELYYTITNQLVLLSRENTRSSERKCRRRNASSCRQDVGPLRNTDCHRSITVGVKKETGVETESASLNNI